MTFNVAAKQANNQSTKQGKAPDLRVRRTRMMIEKAFIDLLMERGFQSITVQDVADRAMVNRATFYDHFSDKYALFEHSVREWFRQTLESKLPADFFTCATNLHFLIATVCEFIQRIDDHCRPNNPDGLPAFDKQVVMLVSEALEKWLEEQHMGGDADSRALKAEVASWAIYGAALHWSLQKHRVSADSYALEVAGMISGIVV
jgi:AcrR family transcriptional regulator